MYITVFKQLIIMLLISVLSYAFSRKKQFSSKAADFLSQIMLFFVNPCLIFSSFNREFDVQKLRELAFVILLSIAAHLLMTVLVTVFIRSKNAADRTLDGIDKVGLVFTNSGFIGIPLIYGVFGQDGVFYLTGYLAVFNIYLWTYGEYQMSHSFKPKKIITNVNVLAVLLGLVLFCMPFTLPEVIAKSLGYISEMNTALSMFLLGLLFATFRKNERVSYTGRVIRVILVRLVACSIVNLLLVYVVWRFTPLGASYVTELFVVYIASLCPVGMSVSSFACIFKKDASYAGLIVLTTSVLCVVSVPLFVRLAELLMGL